MSEQIIPVSTDLWLDMEGIECDGLFRICDGVLGKVLIDKEEVPALIGALHKFQDEHGSPKEVQH